MGRAHPCPPCAGVATGASLVRGDVDAVLVEALCVGIDGLVPDVLAPQGTLITDWDLRAGTRHGPRGDGTCGVGQNGTGWDWMAWDGMARHSMGWDETG